MNMENLIAVSNKLVEVNNKLTEVIKQRDTLAEALQQLIKYQPRSTVVTMNAHHVWRDAREALQSLTPNEL